MLNTFMPEYHFSESHFKIVKAPVEIVYPQIRHLDFNKSLITRILFILRGLTINNLSFDNMVDHGPFFTLGEKINKEWVIGLATRSILLPVRLKPNENFKDWDPGKGIKIVWNFKVQEMEENTVKISTETRVKCLSKKARFWFSIYWFFIKPFSGIVRKEMLRIIKKKSLRRFKQVKPFYA